MAELAGVVRRGGLAELAEGAGVKFRGAKWRGDDWSTMERERRNGIAADTGAAGRRRAAAGRGAGFLAISLRMIRG